MRQRTWRVVAAMTWFGSLLLTGCFDGDTYKQKLDEKQFGCERDADCVGDYRCDSQLKLCRIPGQGPDCSSIYYTATGLGLGIHFPDGSTLTVTIRPEGLDAEGSTLTEPGAYTVTYRGDVMPVQVLVEGAERLAKARVSDCPLKCVGAPVSGYNPATCTDEDCDMYGEGGGCKGADLPDKDGVVDANGAVFPGAPESCDGQDNDGDGQTDSDDLVAPAYEPAQCAFQKGVCTGSVRACTDGVMQRCDYGAAYVTTESDQHCDSLDNDCDGQTDEECSCREGQTESCGTLVGECERGIRRCVEGHWGEECEGAVLPRPEVCDGIDNDCDGRVDEHPDNEAGQACGTTCPDWTMIPIIADVNGHVGVTVCVDRYEASRRYPENPDTLIPASQPNATPWTQVTFAQAQNACILASKKLCPIEVWQLACGSRDNYGDGFPYGPAYQADVCNGNNVAAGPEATGNRSGCVSQWDPRGGGPAEVGRLFDMSGNVKEWVAPPQGSPGDRYVIGGAYDSPPDQLGCHALQQLADGSGAADIGFRCCSGIPE